MEVKPKIEATLNVPQQGHPDPEGRMAKSELYRAAKMSMKLFQMIQDGQQLEAWVQAKITKSADYLDSIYHYMEYQAKFGTGNPAATVDDITMDLPTPEPEVEEEAIEMDESWTYEEKLSALLEAKMKKKMEGFEAGAKPGDTFKTKTGTATKTSTGVKHTRDKFEYDPGSDDKDDKKAKRTAKKKVAEAGEYRRPGSPTAYDRDYASSVSGMNKKDSLAYQMDGGANDEGWDEEPYQNKSDKPVLKGYYFYDVPAGKEGLAAIYGVKKTKNGKWAKGLYSTSGRSYALQKNGADKEFGPGKWWSPNK